MASVPGLPLTGSAYYPTTNEWLLCSVIGMLAFMAILKSVVPIWHIPPPISFKIRSPFNYILGQKPFPAVNDPGIFNGRKSLPGLPSVPLRRRNGVGDIFNAVGVAVFEGGNAHAQISEMPRLLIAVTLTCDSVIFTTKPTVWITSSGPIISL